MASVLDQTNLAGNVGSINLRHDSGVQKVAAPFTCGSSGGVTSAHVVIAASGTPTGNVWAEIWTNNSGSPGVKLGGNSDNLSVNGWDTSATDRTFTWSSNFPIINKTSVFHLVLNSDVAISSSNFLVWTVNNNASFTDALSYNGSSWSSNSGLKATFSDYIDSSMSGMIAIFASI
jgi:hypothetical protein